MRGQPPALTSSLAGGATVSECCVMRMLGRATMSVCFFLCGVCLEFCISVQVTTGRNSGQKKK